MVFETTVTVRSYELDSFGHVNHAAYLNYFEYARFEALREGGYALGDLEEKGLGIHVVRIEVDYRREARMGDELRIRTWVEEFRNTSMRIAQEAARMCGEEGGEAEVVAECRVVAVWIGPDGRPFRIPEQARRALGGT